MLLSFSVEMPIELSEVLAELENITLRFHTCHDLESLLICGVQQTRHLFGSDRAVLYQFMPGGDGMVVAESVSEAWTPVLGLLTYDPCFETGWDDRFRQGAVTAIANVGQSDLADCHKELLTRFQVKANLVSPILVSTLGTNEVSRLWGLLIVHQCQAPYPWQSVHRCTLKQLSTQLGIAIQHLEQLGSNRLLSSLQPEEATQWQVASAAVKGGIWQWDLETNTFFWSQPLKTFLGYGDAAADFIPWEELIHPEDRPQVEAAVNQYVTQQTVIYQSEQRLRTRDGHWQWMLSQGRVVVRNPEGTPIRLMGLLIDISDRKQIELDLQWQVERERALSKVIEAIRSPLNLREIFAVATAHITQCLQSRVSLYEYLPGAACWRPVAVHGGQYGWSEEQAAHIWSDIPDDDNSIATQLKQRRIVHVDNTTTLEAADPLKYRLGQQFPGQWLLIPIEVQSAVWGTLVLTRPVAIPWQPAEIDLGQRLVAQLAIAVAQASLYQELRTAQHRGELVLQGLNESLWDWDAVTNRLQVSDRYWEMLGYDPATQDNSVDLIQELMRIHPEDRAAALSVWQNPHQAQGPYVKEMRLRHRDGHDVWVRNRGQAIWDATGNLARMVGAIEDISDRKAVEVKLQQQEKEFRSLVENNPDGIWRVNRQLQLLYVNPMVESRSGLSKTELLGRPFNASGMSDALAAQWRVAIAQVFATGQEQLLETQETLALREHTFYSRLVPEFDEAGAIVSVLIISRDVTNLRVAQTALQKRVEQEQTLRLITEHMRETLDLRVILKTAVQEVQRSLGVDRTLVFRLYANQPGQVIAETVQPGYPPLLDMQWADTCFLPDCDGLYADPQGWIAPEMSFEDWADCTVDFMTEAGVQSKMVAPLTQRLETQTIVWGLLITHACRRARVWQPEEQDLLQQVAEQLAIAIQQSELHQRLQVANQTLEQIAITDALTQIANRRHFDTTLSTEWQRAQREQRELSLILCDIDHFKQFNDTYGHPAGDACIAAVAQTLQRCVDRATDCLARYGGEEFAMILPHTNVDGAIFVVQKIQTAIATLVIEPVPPCPATSITLSFGIATATPGQMPGVQALINQADQALYQAKQTGRDRYCVSDLATDEQ